MTRSKSLCSVPVTTVTSTSVDEHVQQPRRSDTFYLIGSGLHELRYSKLPKTVDVLRRIHQLFKVDNVDIKVAFRTVVKEIKYIYEHHFNTALIYGETRMFGGQTKESAKLILTDRQIAAVLKQLYADWKNLSYDDSHQDRKGFNTDKFKLKEEHFKSLLQDPLKIHKKNPGAIFQCSGVIQWKTDLLHLENQMKRAQVGTVAGTDKDQKQRDSLRQTRFTRNARVLAKQHTETDSPVELSTTSKSSSAKSSQDEFKEPTVKKTKNKT